MSRLAAYNPEEYESGRIANSFHNPSVQDHPYFCEECGEELGDDDEGMTCHGCEYECSDDYKCQECLEVAADRAHDAMDMER